MGTETTDPEAGGSAVPSRSPRPRKVPAPPPEANTAEHDEKGAKKRTNGDIPPKGGDVKHKKRKAEDVTAALPPALPAE